MKGPTNGRWEKVALIAIALLALGLRLYRLDAQSLWNDEGTSVALAQRDLATITRNASDDIHPPLYHYLLHFWIRLAGKTEFGVRAFSALAGVVLVLGIYLLARRTAGRVTATLAAFLAAVSPFQIYYSQETRMYVLASLLGLLSMLAYGRFLASCYREDPRRVDLASGAIYVLVSVLAIYTHYLALTLLLAQNVGFLLWPLRRTRGGEGRGRALPRAIVPWGAAQTIILLCFVPWLAVSWHTLRSWPAVSAPISLPDLVLQVAETFSLGTTIGSEDRIRLLGLACSLLILPGMLSPRRKQRASGKLPSLGIWEVILYLSIPIASVYMLSLRRPVYKPKFLLLATPAYYILQARGVVSLGGWAGRGARSGRIRVVLSLVLIGAVCTGSAYSLLGLYTNDSFFRDDYRGVVGYIEARAQPEDAIVINAPSQIETVDYYAHGHLAEYPLPRQRPIDVAKTDVELLAITARHPNIYAILWATDESDPEGFIEGWLDRRCSKALNAWFGRLRLAVYAVPGSAAREIDHPVSYTLGDRIRLRGYTLLTPEPESGSILQLTLFWEAIAPIEKRYKVFAHVVDGRGNIVGQRDSEPGGGGESTSEWQQGATITDTQGVLIQPGTPPGLHTLRVGLYSLDDGQRLRVSFGGEDVGDAIDLTTLSVRAASVLPSLSALDMQSKDTASWGALGLEGHSLNRLGFEHQPSAALRPGDAARLTLFWSKGEGDSPGEGFLIALDDRGGHHVWQERLQVTDGTYPFGDWREGEIVRDIHQLPLPRELSGGAYHLTIRPDGWAKEGSYALGRVVIER